MSNKPYVVSGDIYLLLKEWARQRQFILPSQAFFSELRKEFSDEMVQIFPGYEFISEEELLADMRKFADKASAPVVSLSPVYSIANYTIEVTRMLADESGMRSKEIGICSRFGKPAIIRQIRAMQKFGVKEITLADDVIFTGSSMLRLISLLNESGINVTQIIAGIGIGPGVSILRNICNVNCVKEYEEVIDQVCERDFYPGTPYCGRSVRSGLDMGRPYILPFGKPESWASIPKDYAEHVSEFCLKQTIKLFREIKKPASVGDEILYGDIDRKISTGWEFPLNHGPYDYGRPFIKVLEFYLTWIKEEPEFDHFAWMKDEDA